VAIVAPFAVGKSTISRTVCDIDPEFGRVRSFTTRESRPGESLDSYDFRANTIDALRTIAAEINEGQLVQYVVHPTTGDVYGSHVDQYASRYCLLEALPGSIPPLTKLPFGSLAKICLAVEPSVWQGRVQERLASHDALTIKKRIREGIDNIEWALDEDDVSLVDNSTNDPYDCAQSVIETVKNTNQLFDSQQNLRMTAMRLLNHFKAILDE
jgi:hypothetical protein